MTISKPRKTSPATPNGHDATPIAPPSAVAPAKVKKAGRTIAAADVKDGKNEIRLRKIAGEGPLYLAARASFFSLEEPVPARGNQIFVKRQYYKLVGRPTLLKGQVYERVPLEDVADAWRRQAEGAGTKLVVVP